MPAIIFALIVALSGGTAAASSNALPGDALYPVKVNVAEKVSGVFKFSDEGRAEYKLKLAERRLEEAERLATAGRLDTEIKNKLEAKFLEQEEHMRGLISKLEERGKSEIATRLSSNLESKLAAHAMVLEKMDLDLEDESDGKISEFVKELGEKVREKSDLALKMRLKNQSGIKDEFKIRAAENRREAAKKKIETVKEQIKRAENKLGVTATAEVRAIVTEAEHLMAKGTESLEAKNYDEAFDFYQQAHQKVQEAFLLMQTNAEVQNRLRREGRDSNNKENLKIEKQDKQEPEDDDDDAKLEDAEDDEDVEDEEDVEDKEDREKAGTENRR